MRADQGFLCAYCEIDLIEKAANGDADFRVEHFHPKSDHKGPLNWNLEWQNLLGCCHGGSQRTVADAATRFTSPDTSCDIPKADKNLDGVILNPIHLPAFPAVFSCSRSTGELSVLAAHCVKAGVNVQQAEQTIRELNLNAPRLNRLRQQVLNQLNRDLQTLLQRGVAMGNARQQLAAVYLTKSANGKWRAFFTAIRSYLGSDAERHLKRSGYRG
ncbi:retron system putative HNH endonuclease [Marinobacter sp. C2H3]|uniref:retron system putative HNH endonuclease n=1 Tax=Marinobacter sp. C2H3 TaxID=3119003 RepID=UPI003FA5E10B